MDSSFWRQLVDHVAYPIFVKDRMFRFVFVNRACCQMLGRRSEELLGKTDYEFFPREQADFFRQKDAEMFQRDATVTIEEEPMTDARGQLHVLSTTKAPLHGPMGEITHLVGIIYDITPLKRVEEDLRRANLDLSAAQAKLHDHATDLEQLLSEKTAELRKRHDQLQAILASLGEGVLVADAAGAIVRQNEAAKLMTGLGDGAVATIEEWAAALQLRWPDGRPIPADELPLRRALRGEALHNAQLQLRRRGGAKDCWVLLSAAPLPGEAGAVCTLRDVTSLKEAERLKEEFLQVASHELRSPLASLKLLLGVVRAQLKEEHGAVLQPLLLRGHRMVDRMARLINDILDASRLQLRKMAVDPQPLELAALLREAVDRAQGTVGARHRLSLVVESEGGELWVRGDGDRLDQVIGNLLTNACKYSPQDSAVAVRAQILDGQAVVAISDEGPGIAPELQQQIFDRFYQVEATAGRSFGGLGLGLYISRELLIAQGGRLWVESEPGRGSSFFLSIPLQEE